MMGRGLSSRSPLLIGQFGRVGGDGGGIPGWCSQQIVLLLSAVTHSSRASLGDSNLCVSERASERACACLCTMNGE